MTKESILDELAAWKRSNDQRSDLARRAKDKKIPITDIAKAMGVTRGTIYEWLKETPPAEPEEAIHTGVLDPETMRRYLDDAIRAANALRVELGRKIPGPLTVSPHVALLGGVVSVHMAHTQADHLAHIVQWYNPSNPQVSEEVE